ncbi:hypothetical protein CLV30_109117 [Haloactinopolyspora alba]|uniref:Uncharacterized protein n=1 Tax=Haloactinopolyspora alba TaxID=648780 RepID=A0A2P8E037_9ACTN|nr:SHOCT domain-containing protein [Haloactinopolyspora alba]PSL02809.1 hypothetical protein CLV30_109117 [Haloactinopolyspora alba]
MMFRSVLPPRRRLRTATMLGYASVSGERWDRSHDDRHGDRHDEYQGQRPARSAPGMSRPPAQSAAFGGLDVVALLAELTSLRDEGVLSQQEFDVAKRQLPAP